MSGSIWGCLYRGEAGAQGLNEGPGCGGRGAERRPHLGWVRDSTKSQCVLQTFFVAEMPTPVCVGAQCLSGVEALDSLPHTPVESPRGGVFQVKSDRGMGEGRAWRITAI